ncbi:DUF4271 domain-containing protein [Sphingobacterium sp. SRCM116780]|uniref:DUF4271 domain-containing protein n=1 Tax=Sphingobacterium sp. SRCM116780 TaxID=2907623 RepID=UPI001F30DFD7|nr:DUF4271 domain-containing protein [Sphingobacterium sp. SRCM116780]UIR56126.1 DUF4271 domain-containing protein [Sphingobacterium sp. SRCM116780]
MKLSYIIRFVFFFLLPFAPYAKGQDLIDTIGLVSADSTTALDTVSNNAIPKDQRLLTPSTTAYRILDIDGDRIILHNMESYAVTQYFFSNNLTGKNKIHVGVLKYERKRWVLFTSLFLLLAFGVIRFFFSSDVKLIIQAYFNERIIAQVSKEDTILTSWAFIFLYLLFSLSLSLFVCIFYAYVLQQIDFLFFSNYLKVSIIIAVIFALKIGFIRFIAYVFEIQRLVKEYVTILYLIYFNSLLFLLPTVLVVSLVPLHYLSSIFNFTVFIGVILFLYRFLRTALNVVSQQQFSVFYLILYLCCLEIAPILILVRLLS